MLIKEILYELHILHFAVRMFVQLGGGYYNTFRCSSSQNGYCIYIRSYKNILYAGVSG